MICAHQLLSLSLIMDVYNCNTSYIKTNQNNSKCETFPRGSGSRSKMICVHPAGEIWKPGGDRCLSMSAFHYTLSLRYTLPPSIGWSSPPMSTQDLAKPAKTFKTHLVYICHRIKFRKKGSSWSKRSKWSSLLCRNWNVAATTRQTNDLRFHRCIERIEVILCFKLLHANWIRPLGAWTWFYHCLPNTAGQTLVLEFCSKRKVIEILKTSDMHWTPEGTKSIPRINSRSNGTYVVDLMYTEP